MPIFFSFKYLLLLFFDVVGAVVVDVVVVVCVGAFYGRSVRIRSKAICVSALSVFGRKKQLGLMINKTDFFLISPVFFEITKKYLL